MSFAYGEDVDWLGRDGVLGLAAYFAILFIEFVLSNYEGFIVFRVCQQYLPNLSVTKWSICFCGLCFKKGMVLRLPLIYRLHVWSIVLNCGY